MNLVLVFIGGGLGSAARYGMSLAALRLGWIAFPYATLATNVIGCFVMGLITELLALKFSVSQPTRLFLTTGIVGGFTTFSTFALETALHVEQGRAGLALLYAGLSLGLGLAALFGGMALVRTL
ncbi:fluoride efflux transporter CrcB [Achromobacter ruhlandii]|uniref:fluoride efflux transporter CrcB n=1 Tax=Achromobacter ruhlandii TaxID=72557 RepID=UPI0007BF7996|nr:fluoride efflux transporter CrcB [Achromobacter ruhlandii]